MGRMTAIVFFAVASAAGCTYTRVENTPLGPLVYEHQPSDGIHNAIIRPVPGPAQPRTHNDYYQWAAYYTNHNQLEQAVDSYVRAIELNPPKPICIGYLKNHASLLVMLRRHEEALADWNAIVERAPDDPSSYVVRADLFMRLKRYGPAAEDLSRAISLCPDPQEVPPHLYFGRAVAFDNMGKSKEAIADYRKFLASPSKTDSNTLQAAGLWTVTGVLCWLTPAAWPEAIEAARGAARGHPEPSVSLREYAAKRLAEFERSER